VAAHTVVAMTSGEFGQAVRRWRDRGSPEAAGLPAGGRRRAAGLRREELAMLAGISVDYVTRLEQGRASKPSAQVVEALARALRLSETERAHLFRLAGLVLPGNQRNGVWRNLVEPRASRVRQAPEARRAFEAALVSDLRTAMARYPADRRLRQLVADLHAGSPRFAELWDSGAVGRHQATERKTIDHPQAGTLTLDCDVLTVRGSDLRIMIYTAEPGTEDAERLALLTVLGTQALVG
jgi:transcriptional regulator with XRE-family HTH domain